jgi:hypothetical protein
LPRAALARLYRRPGRSSPGGGASRGDGGEVGVSPRLSGRSSPGGGCSISETSSALGAPGADGISSSGRAASTLSSGSGVARSGSSLALLLLSSQNESETIMSSSRAPTPSPTAFVPLLLLRPILPHMLLSPPSLFAPPTNHTPIQPTLENPPLLFLNTLPPSRPASGISHLLPLLTMTKNNTHATPTSRGAPFRVSSIHPIADKVGSRKLRVQKDLQKDPKENLCLFCVPSLAAWHHSCVQTLARRGSERNGKRYGAASNCAGQESRVP